MSEFKCLRYLTVMRLSQLDLTEAYPYLYRCMKKFVTLRGFIKDSDPFKKSLLEKYGASSYQLLRRFLSSTGNFQDALYVEEL